MIEINNEIMISIANSLERGYKIESVHDTLVKKKWSEDNIFLLISAAKVLVNARKRLEEEIKNRPPPFGRK